jgi:hypothetical protein
LTTRQTRAGCDKPGVLPSTAAGSLRETVRVAVELVEDPTSLFVGDRTTIGTSMLTVSDFIHRCHVGGDIGGFARSIYLVVVHPVDAITRIPGVPVGVLTIRAVSVFVIVWEGSSVDGVHRDASEGRLPGDVVSLLAELVVDRALVARAREHDCSGSRGVLYGSDCVEDVGRLGRVWRKDLRVCVWVREEAQDIERTRWGVNKASIVFSER